MKIQSLLLAFLVFALFSCDKKEVEPEPEPENKVRYLKTMKFIYDNTTTTYSYSYNDDNKLIKLVETSDEGTITSEYSYDSENRIQEIDVSDGTNTAKIFHKYQSEYLIQTVSGSDEVLVCLLDLDSMVYKMNNNQLVLFKGYYRSCSTCTPSVSIDDTKYTWINGNVSKIIYHNPKGDITGEDILTFDNKKNPLNFAPGFVNLNYIFDQSFGLPLFYGTENNIIDLKGEDHEMNVTYTYDNDYPISAYMETNDEGYKQNGQLIFEYY